MHPTSPRLTAPFAPQGSTPPPRGGAGAAVASVLAIVLGHLAAAALFVVAVAFALCGLGGSDVDCSSEHQTAWAALVGSAVALLGVPVAVAALRRDGRWLAVPLVEIGLVVLALAWGATG